MAEQLTPNFALPYYEGGDLANGALQQQALASKVDTVLKPISDRIEVPIGAMMMWMMANVPGPRWLFCAGQQVDVATYPLLADVLTDRVAAGKITLPNLKGRVPIGLDAAQPEFDALHEAGGAKALSSVTQLPAHKHGDGTLVAAAHDHDNGSLATNTHGHKVVSTNLGGAALEHVNGYATISSARGGSVRSIAPPIEDGSFSIGLNTDIAPALGVNGRTSMSGSPDVSGSTADAGAAPGAVAASLPPYVVVQFIIRAS